jgi:hypothetical protein
MLFFWELSSLLRPLPAHHNPRNRALTLDFLVCPHCSRLLSFIIPLNVDPPFRKYFLSIGKVPPASRTLDFDFLPGQRLGGVSQLESLPGIKHDHFIYDDIRAFRATLFRVAKVQHIQPSLFNHSIFP